MFLGFDFDRGHIFMHFLVFITGTNSSEVLIQKPSPKYAHESGYDLPKITFFKFSVKDLLTEIARGEVLTNSYTAPTRKGCTLSPTHWTAYHKVPIANWQQWEFFQMGHFRASVLMFNVNG